MNELNYASFEASMRLEKMNIELKTDFYWVKEKTNEAENYELMLKVGDCFIPTKLSYYNRFIIESCNYISAPSMAEVWRELPEKTMLEIHKNFSQANIPTGEPYTCKIFCNSNPTDVLINLLIWVKEKE